MRNDSKTVILLLVFFIFSIPIHAQDYKQYNCAKTPLELKILSCEIEGHENNSEVKATIEIKNISKSLVRFYLEKCPICFLLIYVDGVEIRQGMHKKPCEYKNMELYEVRF